MEEITTNRYVTIKARVDGAPNESDLEIKSEELALAVEPGSSHVIVKVLCVSIDPYQLNRMKTHSSSHDALKDASGVNPGEVVMAPGVGKVVASGCPEYMKGDLVIGHISWGEYSIVSSEIIRKLDPVGFPLSCHLGVLVMCKSPKWQIEEGDRAATNFPPQNEEEEIESAGSSKRSENTEEGDYSIPSNSEDPITRSATVSRPMGRDAAKKRKEKGKASNDVNRERRVGEEHLMNDYFGDEPTYSAEVFRRRFRMQRSLFLRIVEAVSANDVSFQQHTNAAGTLGLTGMQKCTGAIRVLAYGTSTDVVDEYLRMGASTTRQALIKFVDGVISCIGNEYLRRPNAQDLARLL